MPRTRRKQSESSIYHVIQRGTGQQIIFEDDEDRRFFLHCTRHFIERFDNDDYQILAWCLMSNHFHMLIQMPIDDLSDYMRNVNATYAQFFNSKHDRSGHLFQNRFLSEPINSDEYLATVVRYIHANPSLAGICDLEEYQWSSFREYTGEAAEPLCRTEFVMSVFGNTDQFIRFHQESASASSCLDITKGGKTRHALHEEKALEIASELAGATGLHNVKAMETSGRNRLLADMHEHGLSIRQISRLTGIGKNIVERACRKAKQGKTGV